MIIKRLLEHKFLLALVIVYTGLISWLSLARIIIPVEIAVDGSDKIGHLLAYFVFTIVWFAFFFYSKKQSRKFAQSWMWASVLGFLFGILMEVLQASLTDYRSPDWLDVIANTTGVVLAIFLLNIIKKILIGLRGQ